MLFFLKRNGALFPKNVRWRPAGVFFVEKPRVAYGG
jgi:hypothetical protein